MPEEVDLKSMVAHAKKKGSFDLRDFRGVSLGMAEFRELLSLLQRNHIPFSETKDENDTDALPDQRDARRIIARLRVGVPPVENVSAYSIGRETLVSVVHEDLRQVGEGKSRVRFLNGNYGRGKTHSLRLLREKAFAADFVVSEVTLSPTHCPLHEFMRVYREIMKGISTRENPTGLAIESILGRWLNAMRDLPRERVTEIVYNELPEGTKCALGAYYEAQNPVRAHARKRDLVMKYLYGDPLSAPEGRSLELKYKIEEDTALVMLGQIAHLVRYIGYKGLCILLDEAESVHSFASYRHRDRAFQNLQRITRESKDFSHCYFLYATTPSFFANYPDYGDIVGELEVLELESLGREQRLELCDRISDVYGIAYEWARPPNMPKVLEQIEMENAKRSSEIGSLVRAAVAALDELRNMR